MRQNTYEILDSFFDLWDLRAYSEINMGCFIQARQSRQPGDETYSILVEQLLTARDPEFRDAQPNRD